MKKLFLTITMSLLGNGIIAQNNNGATITAADGVFEICVPSSGKLKLKAKLTIPSTHPGVKKFTIRWDSQKTEDFTDVNASLEYDIDLSNFVKNCSGDQTFDVKLKTENNDGTSDNNAYELTFRNIPRPSFKPRIGCSGREISFQNESCPQSTSTKYLWDYGDGSTPDEKGSHLFSAPKTYSVTLTATNKCATNGVKITQNISIIEPAKAAIADSGHVAIRPNAVTNVDTVLYCFGNGGGVFRIDGVTRSTGNPTEFEWRISGGQFNYLERTNSNSPRPKLQLLEKDKIYTIELRVDNACNQPSGWAKCIHIVKDVPALSLKHQDDKCEKFTYKPDPFIREATYKVNGQALPASGEITLDVSTSLYRVEATLNNLCGNQIKRDSFMVAPAQAVSITSPAQNTSICVGATIPLEVNATNGQWVDKTYIKTQNGRDVFVSTDTGTFRITYRRGVGACEKSDSRTIQVKGVSVKVDNKSVCNGVSLIKLTANIAGGTWSTTDCQNCIRNDTLLLNAVSKTNLNIDYNVTAANGCSSKATAQVTIARPKANFTITGACVNQTGTLRNTSQGASSYEWTVNDVPVAENNVISSLRAGPNTIKLVAKAAGCQSDTTISITLADRPNPVSFSLNRTTECSPFSPTISLSGTAEAGVTYTWDIGDGRPINQFAAPAYRLENFGFAPKIFTLSFTIRNACGTLPAQKQEITVNPLTKAEIGVDSTTFRCSPAVVTFSNRSQGASAATWYFGNNTPVPLTDRVITRTFAATNTDVEYVIRLEVSNSCGTNADTIKIKVLPKSMRPLFEISKATDICPGEPIRFRDSSTPKPTQWIWKANGVVFANDSMPKYSFDQENTTYRIRLIAQNGCVKDSVERTVVTKAKPQSRIQVSTNTACSTLPVTFQNTSNPRYTFLWEFGNGQVDSVQFNANYSYPRAGSYRVRLTVFDGSKTCNHLSEVSVNILEKPVPAFELVNSSGLFCSPAVVQFADKSQNATQWFWQIGSTHTSTAQNPSVLLKSGQYPIKLVVGNGYCKDSLQSQVVLRIDTCEVYLPQVFTPNGDRVGDRFNIFGKDPMIKTILHLTVFSRWGEVIYNGINLAPNSYLEGWDGTFENKEMPQGLYPYQTTVQFADGSERTFRGDIRLIR
jgi:gliding motility-associated-like protein